MPTHLTRRQREHLQRLAAGERSATPAWLEPLHNHPKPHTEAARLLNVLARSTQRHPGDSSAPLHLPPELLPPLG